MTFILIGNFLALVTAVFTGFANWTTDKRKSYLYQVWQCVILALANVFFQSWAGISTLILCAIRNYSVYKDTYTKKKCLIFTVAVGVVGVLVNNKGAFGIMLVCATMVYSLGTLVCIRPMAFKMNILVNSLCWMVYEVAVRDYVSAVTDVIVLTVLIVSMVKLVVDKRKGEKDAK